MDRIRRSDLIGEQGEHKKGGWKGGEDREVGWLGFRKRKHVNNKHNANTKQVNNESMYI